MIKAIRKGTVAKFTEGIWKTGIPARAGWVPVGEAQTERVLPKEIIDMSVVQKESLPKEQPAEVKKKDAAAKSIDLKPTATSTLTADVKVASPKPASKPKPKAAAKKKAAPKTKGDDAGK